MLPELPRLKSEPGAIDPSVHYLMAA